MGTQEGVRMRRFRGTQVGVRMRRFQWDTSGGEDEKVPVGTQVAVRMKRFQWGHK